MIRVCSDDPTVDQQIHKFLVRVTPPQRECREQFWGRLQNAIVS